jgi:RNA polymerase sigma factor (sigma-70 family)
LEQELPQVQRSIELLVWKDANSSGRPAQRDTIRETSMEVLQEVARRALSHAGAYDPTRSAHAWLSGIAFKVLQERRRAARNERRRLVRAGAPSLDADVDGAALRTVEQIEDVAANDQQRLLELLSMVELPHRQLIHWRYVDQLSAKDMARQLGIKEGAVRTRLSRAMDRFVAAYHLAAGPGRSGAAGNPSTEDE